MIKRLCCQTPFRRIGLSWVSFQPDGSISYGLSHKTFISPKLKARYFSWNLSKRIRLQDQISTDPTELELVHNPLFTYQPHKHWFHLKANNMTEGQELFGAIVDMDFTLRQQSQMRWIKAVSAPFAGMPTQDFRSAEGPVEDLVMFVPDEYLSACIELTFEKPSAGELPWDQATWCIVWHSVALRITLSFMGPRIPTLTWFQFHPRDRNRLPSRVRAHISTPQMMRTL